MNHPNQRYGSRPLRPGRNPGRFPAQSRNELSLRRHAPLRSRVLPRPRHLIAGSERCLRRPDEPESRKTRPDNTHFCNTTGLHADNHYSTAKDIATLLHYALKNDTFREIIESPYHSTQATNVHPDGFTFYSTMFKNLSDTTVIDGQILGGKSKVHQ